MEMKQSRQTAIASKLIQGYKKSDWHFLGAGPRSTKKDANKFFLGAILDFQIPAAQAWANARRLAEDILGDPEDIWKEITRCSKDAWMGKRTVYRLHRFPKAHERVWRIGKELMEGYGGDARKIWEESSPDQVKSRLLKLRAGKQITEMIIGALFDTGILKKAGDVKADIHVRRVLGRLLRGREFELSEIGEVIKLTREMYPKEPWLLDQRLYFLGKQTCHQQNPDCKICYLLQECRFYYADNGKNS